MDIDSMMDGFKDYLVTSFREKLNNEASRRMYDDVSAIDDMDNDFDDWQEDGNEADN